MRSLLSQLRQARERRLLDRTNAYRLCDGSPWRGVFIDMLAGRLLVSLRDVDLPGELEAELRGSGLPVWLKRLEQDARKPPSFFCGPDASPVFLIEENGVRYRMDMGVGYSQGIFLDQRDNRKQVRQLCRPGVKLLNTFAYTGAFSVCAALAGSTVTTLDLAQPSLNWCRENMILNGLDPSKHYFCRGDTLHWLARFARQSRLFDAIILDPPTFSRDEKGRIWRVERDYSELVSRAAACLSPGGWLLCTTNCRKLSPAHFRDRIAATLPKARLTASPMPFDFDGEAYLKTIWARLP